MNALFSFLANSTGRIVRVVAGLLLIAIGLFWVHGTVGWILAIVGLVPFLAGAFDKCVFAPFFRPSLQRAPTAKKSWLELTDFWCADRHRRGDHHRAG